MKNFNQIFPTDIISEILSCLPTESVLECKSVCKTWKNLINHRSFPQMHLARINHPDSSDSGKLRYVFLDLNYEHINYFEYNDNEGWDISRKIKIETPFGDYEVIGSINGLVCLNSGYGTLCNPYVKPYVDGSACIFNPVSREYILLPYVRNYYLASGFGYIAETDEYKVVRIQKLSEPNFVNVMVYIVGSGNGWRLVGKFDLGFPFYPHMIHKHGVFLNECLHWRNTVGGMIVVFDLAQEKFRNHISPPPMLTVIDGAEDFDSPMIGASGGGILYYAVCQSEGGREVSDVWLLKGKNGDHVTKEQEEHQSLSWSKVNYLDQKEPFAFTGYGDALRYDEGTVNMFVSASSTWEPLVAAENICRQIFSHKHTLVSLKDFGEENVKIMGYHFEDTDSSD